MQTSSSTYLVGDLTSQEQFRRLFDRRPFAFSHRLHLDALFSRQTLLNLAERLSRETNRWYIEEGETKPESGWSARPGQHTLVETLDDISNNHSLVMLKRVHEEPDYRPVLDALRDDLSQMTGIDIASRYRDGVMTVLITSPHRITPYHIDGEANLLMQMSGGKTVYIFDGERRDILPVGELEGFWSGDLHAPRYKEHLQDEAWRFDLSPGCGVSNPVAFPHWVRNGDEVSISLSANFKRRIDNVADAHRINSRLRRLGLSPAPPGKAHSVDRMKGTVCRAARWMKRRIDQRASNPA